MAALQPHKDPKVLLKLVSHLMKERRSRFRSCSLLLPLTSFEGEFVTLSANPNLYVNYIARLRIAKEGEQEETAEKRW